MKKINVYFIVVIIIFIFNSCQNHLSLDKIKNSKWLYYDFGNCEDVYSFKDTTFITNSCEIMESFRGWYWINNDTIYMLIPKPFKMKILVSGDSVEVFSQKLHSYRPTLEKLLYKNDTLFFTAVYDNYLEENQSKHTDFEIKYLTRIQ